MTDIKDNTISLLKGDLLEIHEYLDTLYVPKEDKMGTYTIIGRIKRMQSSLLEKQSELESHYLQKDELNILLEWVNGCMDNDYPINAKDIKLKILELKLKK